MAARHGQACSRSLSKSRTNRLTFLDCIKPLAWLPSAPVRTNCTCSEYACILRGSSAVDSIASARRIETAARRPAHGAWTPPPKASFVRVQPSSLESSECDLLLGFASASPGLDQRHQVLVHLRADSGLPQYGQLEALRTHNSDVPALRHIRGSSFRRRCGVIGRRPAVPPTSDHELEEHDQEHGKFPSLRLYGSNRTACRLVIQPWCAVRNASQGPSGAGRCVTARGGLADRSTARAHEQVWSGGRTAHSVRGSHAWPAAMRNREVSTSMSIGSPSPGGQFHAPPGIARH